MTNQTRFAFALPLVLTVGCFADLEEPSDEPSVDAPVDSPDSFTVPLAGTYRGSQDWDLSQLALLPAGGGDVVSAMLIEEVVSASGVPGFLEGQAQDALDALIGDVIADAVDEHLGTSELVLDLSSVLRGVTLDTTLVVEESEANAFSAREELTGMTLRLTSGDVDVPLERVLSVGGYDEVVSEFDAELNADGARLQVPSHDYQLRVDEIISFAGVEILSYESLDSALSTLLDCPSLMAPLVDATGDFHFSVAGNDFVVGSSTLGNACESAKAELTSFVLAHFRLDTGISAGGGLKVERSASSVSFTETEYAGAVGGFGLPVEPSFDIAYRVDRQ